MNAYLIVVDMQNDFIDGALGTKEAQAIVPQVLNELSHFRGTILFTRDTHEENYLETAEGKKLPLQHCIKGTRGWEIRDELQEFCMEPPIDKPTFGSMKLVERLQTAHQVQPIEQITLIGLCTDICVISNAMLIKAALPEVKIMVKAACCAGVTPDGHETALNAMKACHIDII